MSCQIKLHFVVPDCVVISAVLASITFDSSFLFSLQDLTPDYSMESHQRDHENFLVVSRTRRRRAKALLDFERHDDDELGFRKNDIITVSYNKIIVLFTMHKTNKHPLSPTLTQPHLSVLDHLTKRRALLGWRAQWP